MKPEKKNICPLCGGGRRPGETTFTVELGFGIVVIRHVPAMVCSQCGADWIADETASRIEKTVESARAKHNPVEVVAFA